MLLMNYPSEQAERFAAELRNAKKNYKAALRNLRLMLAECFGDATDETVPDGVVIRVSKLLLDIRFEEAHKHLEVED